MLFLDLSSPNGDILFGLIDVVPGTHLLRLN